MRKRQSGLHRKMQKPAEMTDSARQIASTIREMHWIQKKSLRDVAKVLNLSWSGLQWYLNHYQIPRKSRLQSMIDKFRGTEPRRWTYWKGGRQTYRDTTRPNPSSYTFILIPDHPNANKRGYVPEHRYVMSQFIGRPIANDEIVHHRNGDTLDNHLENLELRKRGGAAYYHGPLAACPKCGFDLSSRG